MLAVPLAEEEAARLPGVSIAALNAPGVTVLSGTFEAIEEVERLLRTRGIEGKRLHTSHAFHSAMMDPILAEFRDRVSRVRLSSPEIPYLSNLTGTWISAAEATDPNYWASHLRRPVRFGQAITELLRDPDRLLLEVGPGQALRSLALRCGDKVEPRVVSSLGAPRDGTPADAALLDALGKLYFSDVDIDWSGVHDAASEGSFPRRLVPLPTYPFERQRYTRDLDSNAFGTMQAGSNAPPTKSLRVEDWLYAPSWKRSPALATPDHVPGPWLIFADDSTFGLSLATAIAEAHHDVTVVTPGTEFRRISPRQFEIDPTSADHHRDIINELLSTTTEGPLHVVHLWGLAPGAPAAAGHNGFAEAQRLGFYSVLNVLQALRHAPAADVSILTDGALPVLGDERLRPEAATVLALCQVAPLEMPRVHCRAIDVALDGDNHSRLLDRVLRELHAGAADNVVAYRGAHRWIPAFERIQRPAVPTTPILREQGVYLVLGGLGGLGLALAEHLARTARARLVLTSRSGLVAREEWDSWLHAHHDSDRISRQIRKIREIESLGVEVLPLSADVADERQMAAVVERAMTQFGALHGVIHAAGVAGEEALRALDDTTSQHVEAQFRAKAQGLYVLERVLPQKLDFCLLCSSLSTTIPGVGFAAYAAANHFLDAFAADRAGRDARRWTAVDWDAWQPAGAPAEPRSLGAALASLAILPDEGGTAFDAILPLDATQIIVSTIDLEARREGLRRLHVAAESHHHPREPAAAGQERPDLDNDYVAPRNELEAKLAEIWQKLLGIDRIGVEDNFFKLGGDSLIAIQLGTRLRDTFGLDVPINDLFESPTIAALAQKIERLREAGAGGPDAVDATLSLIENMSEEEVKRMLAELGKTS
ncbi:MAG: SDR family NAD(P)-dependent oxidoreductase [Minicystis sp.]